MSEHKKPKIFLSYAHEDIGMAKRIYQDLNNYGLNIWFDTESLEVGQLWENAILDAIEESDYFIAVLSSNSITKKGYVQKELKTALKVIDLLPEEEIYILPVRIDDCLVKNRQLKKHHWINIFPEDEYQNGLKKILQVVSPGTFIIRNEEKELSVADVIEMLKLHGYHDSQRNPTGKGINHKYKAEVINGYKVITDNATNLMWQQSGSSKEMDYEEAKRWIEKLNRNEFAEQNDWRLPTLEEAMSLVEPKRKRKNEDLCIDTVFDTIQRWIWTSDIKGERRMWIVNFSLGYCNVYNIDYDYGYVRAVRLGQSSGD